MDNLRVWKAVERTDPRATKQFSRGGGFRGTAISPMWLIKRATELWGPIGDRWGISITRHQVIDGAPILLGDPPAVVGRESIHVVEAEVWYPGENGTGHLPCFGQTQLVGKNKNGVFTDEEAPKKSLTDALTKGLSWLGFAADVHMGLFDDVKYVNTITREFQEEEAAAEKEEAKRQGIAALRAAANRGLDALAVTFKSMPKEMREACEEEKNILKAQLMGANHAAASA